MPPRRIVLFGLFGLVATGLVGCGFRLREPLSLPFRNMSMTGFAPRSPMAEALRRRLQGLVTLLPGPDKAELVLHVTEDQRERSSAASTAAGQVREVQLRLRLTVRADTPGGRSLMAPVTLRGVRELSYNETAALAKADEEASLYADMQADVIGQLLRRLAAVEI